MQQRQQNTHRFLLVPTQYHRQGQIVHTTLERIRQRNGNLNRRIRIIALADIQQSRDAANVAERQLVKPVLAACQRQDHAIIRDLLCKISIVVASGLGPVAAADQEEMPNLLSLDRIDHGSRNAHHGIVSKADGDGFLFGVFGKSRCFQCGIDHGRKILIHTNMFHIRPGHQTGRKDPAFVAVARLLNAVGRHQDRAWKGVKLGLLVLPRPAVVADEVLVLLQLRIRTTRQHFTVRINIDTFAFCLFQQNRQILQVVAGHQNRFARHRCYTHHRRLRMAIRFCIGFIEHPHDL